MIPNDFYTAVLRESNLLLDNVGICIPKKTLPTWDGAEAARENLYGTHWLSRLWCQRIRPKVDRKAHLQAVKRYEAMAQLHRAAFMSAVFDRAVELGLID